MAPRRKPPRKNEAPKETRRRKGKDKMPDVHPPNPDYPGRLRTCNKRSILPEKSLNEKQLGQTFVFEEVQRRSWETFVSFPKLYNPALVREFYAAMVPSEFEAGAPVRVQGKLVFIPATEINEFLKTRSYSEWDKGYEQREFYRLHDVRLARALTGNPTTAWTSSQMFFQRQLGFREHFWNVYFSYSLIPSGHRSDLTLDCMIIAHCMQNQHEFDVGKVIRKKIADTARRSSSCLIFPCIITYFIQQAGVEIRDGLQTVTQTVGRRPYNEAARIHREDLLLTEVELKKLRGQQRVGTSEQIDPEAEAMDAEMEDVDEDDDEPEQIPTWAKQFMDKIVQSNVVLAKSNRKLAAEVRGLKEVIARMMGYQTGGPSEYTDEQSQQQERRMKRRADPHTSPADQTPPFVDDQMHSASPEVQNQHTQTGTDSGTSTNLIPNTMAPDPISAAGPLPRSSSDLQIRPISSSSSGDSTP